MPRLARKIRHNRLDPFSLKRARLLFIPCQRRHPRTCGDRLPRQRTADIACTKNNEPLAA
jgi:hypothetical protein